MERLTSFGQEEGQRAKRPKSVKRTAPKADLVATGGRTIKEKSLTNLVLKFLYLHPGVDSGIYFKHIMISAQP